MLCSRHFERFHGTTNDAVLILKRSHDSGSNELSLLGVGPGPYGVLMLWQG